MKRTQEERQAHMKQLRAQWQSAKKRLEAGEIDAIQAIIATHGLKISATGFMFVSVQMAQQGLDGLPYLDAKTYEGWRQNGFQVKRGEHSTLSGVTWISPKRKGDSEDSESDSSYMFPREYHLFHRSQVEAIADSKHAA